VAALLKVLQEALVKPVLRGDGVVALLVAAQLAAADTAAGEGGACVGTLVHIRCVSYHETVACPDLLSLPSTSVFKHTHHSTCHGCTKPDVLHATTTALPCSNTDSARVCVCPVPSTAEQLAKGGSWGAATAEDSPLLSAATLCKLSPQDAAAAAQATALLLTSHINALKQGEGLQGPSILHFTHHPGMCLQLLAGNAAFGAAVCGASVVACMCDAAPPCSTPGFFQQ
jgi:hypothetical protein